MTNLQLEVISLANEGLTCADICRKLNRSVSTVSGILVKFKDQIKDRQYYYQNTINHEYFDIIDSDIKAYFLGFFIADGTIGISKRCIGRMGFCIQNDDSYILEKLLNNINCPNKIYVRINLNGAKCRKPQAILRWTSQHMSSTLINKYKILPNKTKDVNFKFDFSLIPEQFHGSFIRGFIDGDGSFEQHDHTFNPVIVGTSEIWLKQIGDLISKKTGLSYKFYSHQGKTIKYHSLRWHANRTNKKEKINKLYHFLYDNAEIYLSRKREKILAYLNTEVN